VYDYVDGKVDWLAYGLPVEGDDGPFLGEQATEVPTCDATLTVADARRVLESSDAEDVLLVHGEGLVVGDVDAEVLDGKADDAPLLDVLRPVPSTVRPSVTVASVAEGGGGDRVVTTSNGRLMGRAQVATTTITTTRGTTTRTTTTRGTTTKMRSTLTATRRSWPA